MKGVMLRRALTEGGGSGTSAHPVRDQIWAEIIFYCFPMPAPPLSVRGQSVIKKIPKDYTIKPKM